VIEGIGTERVWAKQGCLPKYQAETESRNANACVDHDENCCNGGMVEIHTESWVDEAGSYRLKSVVVHYLVTYKR